MKEVHWIATSEDDLRELEDDMEGHFVGKLDDQHVYIIADDGIIIFDTSSLPFLGFLDYN